MRQSMAVEWILERRLLRDQLQLIGQRLGIAAQQGYLHNTHDPQVQPFQQVFTVPLEATTFQH